MKNPPRVLGVDLDNTLIRYDEAFHRAAVERGWIEPETPVAKTSVKQAVLARHTNREWTELQGHVYGPAIGTAAAYPGAMDFFAAAARAGTRIHLISHKTRFAAAGPAHDLRAAALGWLEQGGWFDPDGGRLDRDRVHFTDDRAGKVRMVAALGCEALIDDLPEVFREPAYPAATRFLLFDPDGAHTDWTDTPRFAHWVELAGALLP